MAKVIEETVKDCIIEARTMSLSDELLHEFRDRVWNEAEYISRTVEPKHFRMAFIKIARQMAEELEA